MDFNITKALSYSGEDQGAATASVTVSIAAAPETVQAAAPDYATEGILAEGITDEGGQQMYIWTNLENVTIPSKYSETTVDYKGQTVPAVSVQDSDAPTLLYLSNASGENGGYYIYDAAKSSLYRYCLLYTSFREPSWILQLFLLSGFWALSIW